MYFDAHSPGRLNLIKDRYFTPSEFMASESQQQCLHLQISDGNPKYKENVSLF